MTTPVAVSFTPLDYCLRELIGRDARYVVGAWDRLYRHLLRTGMGAITTLAMAAIDVALWEVRARASGRPMHVELGGHADSIPAYTSGIDIHMAPDEIAATQKSLRDAGYRWFKIKVGKREIGDDIARLAAAREAVGPDCRLVVDANQAWDLSEGVRRCRAFEPYDIAWMEEPLEPDDIGGHAALRGKTAIPIALGESLYTVDQFLAFLQADAVDIVQADIIRVGGFTPWLRIADLAAAWRKPVAPHFSQSSPSMRCARQATVSYWRTCAAARYSISAWRASRSRFARVEPFRERNPATASNSLWMNRQPWKYRPSTTPSVLPEAGSES